MATFLSHTEGLAHSYALAYLLQTTRCVEEPRRNGMIHLHWIHHSMKSKERKPVLATNGAKSSTSKPPPHTHTLKDKVTEGMMGDNETSKM